MYQITNCQQYRIRWLWLQFNICRDWSITQNMIDFYCYFRRQTKREFKWGRHRVQWYQSDPYRYRHSGEQSSRVLFWLPPLQDAPQTSSVIGVLSDVRATSAPQADLSERWAGGTHQRLRCNKQSVACASDACTVTHNTLSRWHVIIIVMFILWAVWCHSSMSLHLFMKQNYKDHFAKLVYSFIYINNIMVFKSK